jgi:parallel beta-helix repeat protein
VGQAETPIWQPVSVVGPALVLSGASQLSSAVIVNNIIQNNFQAGIGVAETSFAFIGFVNASDTVASPNVITGNRAQGIAVFRGSYARIVGNDISNNGANGVNVRESSSAQISDNTVNGNVMNGILVTQGSGVLLGADTGNTIFTRPNTTTINNGAFGIRCQVAAHADGRLGTLNGTSGPENYIEGCIPSLTPWRVLLLTSLMEWTSCDHKSDEMAIYFGNSKKITD